MTSNSDALMDQGPPGEIAVGLPVYTRDGTELGKVKEVRTGYFKLDVTLQEDFWLRADNVSSITADRIIVDFNRGDLRDHRVEDPDADRSGKPRY